MNEFQSIGSIEYWIKRFISGIFYWRLYRIIYPKNPFFTPKSIEVISKKIDKTTKVFEWGSGASTIWFAERVKEIISVEHNQKWYNLGIQQIEKKKLKNVTLIYSPTDESYNNFNWESDWKYFNVLNASPRKKEFKNYFHQIDKYPDDHFDCIIVDGRERVSCLLHAMSKLNNKGFIILDDSNRKKYNEIHSVLSAWKKQTYGFGLLETTIFEKNGNILEHKLKTNNLNKQQ